jgi:Putative amidase domain
MGRTRFSGRTTSRRSLVAFGAALVAAGTAERMAPAARAASGLGGSWLLSTLQAYLDARALAANGNSSQMNLMTSSDVFAYECQRAKFIGALGSASAWDGTLVGISSIITGVSATSTSATVAQAVITETMTIAWRPNPRAQDPAYAARRAADPARYGLLDPLYPLVSSQVSTEHAIVLERAGTSWAVVSDAYAEPDLFGSSPDVQSSPQIAAVAAVLNQQPAASAQKGMIADGSVSPDCCSHPPVAYDYAAAVTYAKNHGATADYNQNYVSYNGCGGDCANFVSQCFYVGNQLPDQYWQRYQGSACGQSGWCGSDRWVNNWLLHNWVINQNRGAAVDTIGGLGKGDIVNYDWTQNGSYDHVTIVSDGANNLVCSHNVDRVDVPWKLGDDTANHKFTNLYSQYTPPS